MAPVRGPCTQPHSVAPVRDLNPWLLYMAFMQLLSICGVKLIERLFTVLPKAQLFWSAKDP